MTRDHGEEDRLPAASYFGMAHNHARHAARHAPGRLAKGTAALQ